MNALKKIRLRIEKELYLRGIGSASVRALLCNQFLLVAASFAISIPALLFTSWPFVFAIGAAIAAYHFWYLAKFSQQVIFCTYSLKLAFAFVGRFMIRMAITCILLFLLIVWLRVPLMPLLGGLATNLVVIIFWSLAKTLMQPPKEA